MDFTIKIKGTAPLLMHSDRFVNRMDEGVKMLTRITSKRKKTETDLEDIARLEHRLGMYHDEEIGPYLPGWNILRTIQEGAKQNKNGLKIERGVFIETDMAPVRYSGPRDKDGLWEDKRFVHNTSVGIGQKRVMRCRPVFPEWEVEASGWFDEEVIEKDELVQAVELAGRRIGIGDYRPRFGRFTAEVTF